jgi:hypothetical protein
MALDELRVRYGVVARDARQPKNRSIVIRATPSMRR